MRTGAGCKPPIWTRTTPIRSGRAELCGRHKKWLLETFDCETSEHDACPGHLEDRALPESRSVALIIEKSVLASASLREMAFSLAGCSSSLAPRSMSSVGSEKTSYSSPVYFSGVVLGLLGWWLALIKSYVVATLGEACDSFPMVDRPGGKEYEAMHVMPLWHGLVSKRKRLVRSIWFAGYSDRSAAAPWPR